MKNSPTAQEVKQARLAAGLTQTEAADLIHCATSAWVKWEGAERGMHPAMWELFRLKTRQARLVSIAPRATT